MALGYATVFGSAIAYGIFFYLASKGNLTSLSALTFLTPIFALLFGTLLLSESLSTLQWCGVMLTLLSIYLINRRTQIAAWLRQQQPNNRFLQTLFSPNPVAQGQLDAALDSETITDTVSD